MGLERPDMKGFTDLGVNDGGGAVSTLVYTGEPIDGQKSNSRVVRLDNGENQVVRLDVG